MPEGNGKPESRETDPAKLAQLLEIELMQKRAAWQQAKARRKGLRTFSFFFLFVVIIAGLFGFFVLLSPDRVGELRSEAPESEEAATPTPAPSPK